MAKNDKDPEVCDQCETGPTIEHGPVDLYWATAEKLGIPVGYYHWDCAHALIPKEDSNVSS
jgi:hypothetical protein